MSNYEVSLGTETVETKVNIAGKVTEAIINQKLINIKFIS